MKKVNLIACEMAKCYNPSIRGEYFVRKIKTAVNPLQQSIRMMTVEIRSQKSMPMGRKRAMNITAGILL